MSLGKKKLFDESTEKRNTIVQISRYRSREVFLVNSRIVQR